MPRGRRPAQAKAGPIDGGDMREHGSPEHPRWKPDPRPGDGPEGRGESGAANELQARRETEEAARTGRFPDGDQVRDDSNPIEPEEPAEA